MTKPLTPAALGAFFSFATLMTGAVFVTLFAPGTPLDEMWAIKPREYDALLLLRPASTAGFALLCALMATTAAGVFLRKRWGLRLAIAIFALNALGDAWRALTGSPLEGLLGVSIAGAVLWWLAQARVRSQFN